MFKILSLYLLAIIILSSEDISVFITDFYHEKVQFESNYLTSQSELEVEKIESNCSFKCEQILKI